MALKPCKECKKEVSTDAQTCPHCGKANPTKNGGGCLTLLVAIFVVVVVANMGNCDSEAPKQQASTSIAARKEDLSNKYLVVADTAEERASPSNSGQIVNRVYAGQRITVYSTSGQWARVTAPGFTARWINVGKLRPETGTASAKQTIPADYRVVEQWTLPGGGVGQVIVVPKTLGNEEGLRRIGARLRSEADGSSNAMIFIYDDKRAALLRPRALRDELNATDMKFHDDHMVGVYNKNGHTGFHQFMAMPHGASGATIQIPY